jgi:hypothetical protein
MLRTSKLDMAESVKASDIDVFLSDAAWAVCSTYHTVLKASPGAGIFGRDMLFDIPFIADWRKIGEYRQQLSDLNNARENEGRIDYDYKVGQKVLLRKDGILRKSESISSEVKNEMIIMGHQITSCHVPVVRSFFILKKMLLPSYKSSI